MKGSAIRIRSSALAKALQVRAFVLLGVEGRAPVRATRERRCGDETATARGYPSAQSLSGGRPFFPALDERIERDLVEQRTFGSRMVYLRYRRV
jgi:hypothetical protein